MGQSRLQTADTFVLCSCDIAELKLISGAGTGYCNYFELVFVFSCKKSVYVSLLYQICLYFYFKHLILFFSLKSFIDVWFIDELVNLFVIIQWLWYLRIYRLQNVYNVKFVIPHSSFLMAGGVYRDRFSGSTSRPWACYVAEMVLSCSSSSFHFMTVGIAGVPLGPGLYCNYF